MTEAGRRYGGGGYNFDMQENFDSHNRWNEPNLAPTEVKRQHYVPDFFLESFTGPDNLIRVVDFQEGKKYRTNPTNAAVQSYYNDLEVDGDILSTESWLGQLETRAGGILKRLIENPDELMSLSIEEEMHLARFIAALRFRTPQFRASMAGIMTSMADQTKELIRKHALAMYGDEEGSALWEEQYKGQIEQMFLGEQPADLSTSMLGDVQGWANLLRGAPWRIGTRSTKLNLYTSDNPVAAYQHPVKEWELQAFSSFIYYVPLSTNVLLKIERRPNRYDESAPRGPRRRLDFTTEEISVARHVVTQEATRFLYGEGLIVPRDCATRCLKMIGDAKLKFAIKYLGFDPRPPKGFAPPTFTG